MKIIGCEKRDDQFVITTDFKEMPVFVYPVDRFKDLDALEKEIEKKCAEITIRTQHKASREAQLQSEIEARVQQNAGN